MKCCVLDTSAILQRFQPSSANAEYLIDTLYENKRIELDLPFACISEVIQQFYNAHRKSQGTAAAMTEGQLNGLINRLRKDIQSHILLPYSVTDSLFAKTETIFNTSFKIQPRKAVITTALGKIEWGKREPIDIADMLVIATAMELMTIPELVKEVYLFTSDGHLFDTATALGIQCYDPRVTTINQMAPIFNRRAFTRINNSDHLRVVCKDCVTPTVHGPARLVDICRSGLCLEQPSRTIGKGQRVHFTIPAFRAYPQTTREGTAVWVTAKRLGVQLDQPLPLN